MEEEPPLAIESFSHSWLTSSVNSSSSSYLDCVETSLRPSIDGFYDFNSRELDYKMLRSRRSVEEESHKFYFDIPVLSQSAAAGSVAPADLLFSDGLIKPSSDLYDKSQTSPAPARLPNPSSATTPASPPPPPPSSAVVSKRVVSAVNIQCTQVVVGRWRKLSVRVLLNYFRRLKHSWARSSRKSIRILAVKTSTNSPPRRSTTAYSTDGWSDADSSIYEAVLHCKRSIGK